jgi:hypothetical protein
MKTKICPVANTVDTLLTHTPRSQLQAMGYEGVWYSRKSPKIGQNFSVKIL